MANIWKGILLRPIPNQPLICFLSEGLIHRAWPVANSLAPFCVLLPMQTETSGSPTPSGWVPVAIYYIN